MHLRKKFFGVAALTMLLAPVIFFLLVYAAFDKDDYKSFIENSIFESTGLIANIRGDIGYGYAETLQLLVEDVMIKSLDEAEVVEVEQLGISVDLYDLLKGRWHVDEVYLSKVDLTITAVQPKKTGGDNPVSITALPFKKLTLKDSILRYENSSSQFGFQLHNLNAMLQESNQFTAITLNFDYLLKSGQAGNVNADAELVFGNQLKINNLKNQVRLEYGDIKYDLILEGSLSVDQALAKLQTKDLRLSSNSFELQSSIDLDYSPEKALARLDLQAFNLIPIAQWLTSQPVNIKSQDLLKVSNSELILAYETNELSVDIVALTLGDSRLVGELSYRPNAVFSKIKIDQVQLDQYMGLLSLLDFDENSQADEPFKIDASLQINRLNFENALIEPFINHTVIDTNGFASDGQFQVTGLKPKEYLQKIQFLNDDVSKALGLIDALDGGLKYQFSPERITFSDIDLKINDTDLQGNFEYLLDKPAIYSNLTISSLDLDRYQILLNKMPESQSETQSSPINELLGQLKSIGGEGHMKINLLKYQGLEYRGIDIHFSDS